MGFKWIRTYIEKLILLIQQNECIYNVRSRDYLDRTKKAESFNKILKEMQQSDSSITLDDIKKKWKNLRIQFMSERRQIEKSKKSGSGACDLYKPNLWCFDQLSFLTQHTDIKKSRNNIEDAEDCTEWYLEDSCESTLQSESTDDTLISKPLLEKRNKKYEENRKKKVCAFQEKLSGLQSLMESRKSAGKKYSWLGAVVTNRMDEINPEDQPAAVWKVQCMMQKLVDESQNKRKAMCSATNNSSLSYMQPPSETSVLKTINFNTLPPGPSDEADENFISMEVLYDEEYL